jgi:hypothetical protein
MRARTLLVAIGLAGLCAVAEDLQKTIDAAPPHSVVVCDPNRELTLSTPLKIEKPLTLRGLHARLPEKLSKTPLVIVTSKGVTISDFELTGNVDTVPAKERAPLLIIAAGDFRVENGRFNNSSKDGVMIDADVLAKGDIVGGVVRDIVGNRVARDVVSISGGGHEGYKIRNVLVDNIRGYNSSARGTVEVSDGTDNITVRKIYAEGNVYAIDVQDHKQPAQINRNVVIEDVYAVKCKFGIRTDNRPLGHANLTIRDVTARQCAQPLQVSNTDNVTLSNIRVFDHEGGMPPVNIRNCNGLSVRDVVVENTAHKGPAMLMEDCDSALVDGFRLRGAAANVTSGICYRLATARAYSALRITNVSAAAGILLEATAQDATLTDYIVSGNLARVLDKIHGHGAIVVNNLLQ